MTLRQTVSTLLISFLLSLNVAAQSIPTEKQGDNPQKLETTKAFEEKAVALLEEILIDSRTLRSTLNRLRIEATVADLLWPRAEERARALFKEVIKEFVEVINAIDYAGQRFYQEVQAPMQLRQEVMQMLARHDGQMAYDFLRSTRIPQLVTSGYLNKDYELGFELQLAQQLAINNPKLALQIALDGLEEGFSLNLPNLLTQLREKDPQSAAQLATEIVRRLQSQNLLMSQEAASVAINLLIAAKGSEAHSSSQRPEQPSAATPLLTAAAYTDLLNLVISAASKAPTYFNPSDWRGRNAVQNLLVGLPSLMPEIEKYAPSSVATLQRKMVDFRKSMDQSSLMWQEYQDLFQNGSVDDILSIVAKVPEEQRPQVYQQAAWKAISQGNVERARQIVNENLTNLSERRQLLEQFDRQMAMKAMNEGKSEAARGLSTRLRSKEDRAMLLIQLANVLVGKGDRKAALQLIDEARSLYGNRAENNNQMSALLSIAHTYAPLEAERAFEIIELLVGQLNELLAAAEVLNGFDQQYYKDGELMWQGSSLSNLVSQTGNELGQLARADFDRATEIAAEFQRPEARILARLLIAQTALSGQTQTALPIQGRTLTIIN